MQSRTRTTLLIVSAFAIILLVCGGGIIIANNAMDNLLPGDSWFGVRQFKESLAVSFARDADTRAAWEMGIVSWRLNDLALSVGMKNERAAFSRLDDAVNATLVTIAELPANERMASLQHMAEWLYAERELLAKTALSRDATFLSRFDNKFATIQSASENDPAATERLRQVAVSLPLPADMAVADSSTIAAVAPRTIPVPTGFKHSFPIDGAHAKVVCEKCHAAGKYTGAPRDCVACHRDPHTPTLGQQCATCHTTNAWKPAKKK